MEAPETRPRDRNLGEREARRVIEIDVDRRRLRVCTANSIHPTLASAMKHDHSSIRERVSHLYSVSRLLPVSPTILI